jgi:hypothetical protein
MARYDRGYDPGFRPMSLGIVGSGGYARDFVPRAGYDRGFEWAERMRGAGMWGRGVGTYRQWGTQWEADGSAPRGSRPGRGPDAGHARWDRSVYDADFPARGGYYGSGGNPPPRGRHPGGPRPSQSRGPEPGGAFLPEEAYRRHPELSRGGHEDEPWDERAYLYYGGGPDEQVERAVRARMYQDGWLDADAIQVDVRQGVVTLRGEVGDFMEARYAWDDAWETDGVRGVVNNLTVRLDEGTHGDPMPQDVHTER